MRPRINLWLKKRGARRTGSQRWAASGEVLYHAVFIGVGLIAAWLHTTNVLMPEWRRRASLASFEPAQCVIVEPRLDVRQGVGDSVEYLPQCRVQVERDGKLTPPVLATAGDASTSRRRAQRQLNRWVVGEKVECWFDPNDPRDVVMSRAGHGWPLVVLSIPLTLIVIGVVGVVRAVLRAGASGEFRRVMAKKTLNRSDTSRLRAPPPESGLPSADEVGDSPGVKLQYRLPRDNRSGWRLAGMLFICIAWNALVGFFLYGVIHDHVTGAPDWAVTLVITPLAVAGGWLAYQMLRDAQGVSGVGVTCIEVASHPLQPGSKCNGVILQSGQFTARTLTIALVCEERAIYRQGTDTRRSAEDVHREVLHRATTVKAEPDAPYESEFSFTIPPGAMHSLQTPHNEVRWAIEVAGTPSRWPAFKRRFRLCVYPKSWPKNEAPTITDTAAANAEALA